MPDIVDIAVSNIRLPATVGLAAIAALGYMVSHFRSGKAEFTLMDALIVAMVVAIIGGTSVPMIEMVSQRAKTSALLRDLHTLRSQIELYKMAHKGEAPVLYEGGFPQLIRATNADGLPGESSSRFPYGPYLRSGIPVNAKTGRSIVTPVESFPPTKPSGNGGWLYHQETGQIVPDLTEFLD